MTHLMTSGVDNNWSSLILHGVNPTGKEIGRGAYGRVFEVNYEGTLCAAKEVHALLLQYAEADDLQKIKDDFLNECQMWSTLRHPYIVQFLGVYYPAMDQHRLPVMVMEKMQHSLRGLVEKYDNIPLNVKLSILDEVCLGLRYLHSRNPPIVHRDLTPNNILLGYHLEAKITDLGVAKMVKTDNQKTMTKLPGTPDFMPPEALSVRPVYGPLLDVFSYGGVILNVITQLWPQPTDPIEFNPDTGRREVVSEVKRRQQFLDKITGGAVVLKPLVMSCLDDNPSSRPTTAQISTEVQRIKYVHCGKSSRDSSIVWWAEVSNEQQQQATNSLATAPEDINEQLRKEISTLKADMAQLRDKNDEMNDENKQLTALLNKMAINNQSQIEQINSVNSENATMKDENRQLRSENFMMKAESYTLKAENLKLKDDLEARLVDTSTSLPTPVFPKGHELKQHLSMEESTTPGVMACRLYTKWEEGSPVPVGCKGHTAVWLHGLVYVGGGFTYESKESYIIYCYDPFNNSWSSPINTPYHHFAMTALNNKLLIAGGMDKKDKTDHQVSTVHADQIKNYSKMITPRLQCSATGHQGMLIITGGFGDKGKMLSSTELFDSIYGHWYMCNDLPQPHFSLRSVVVDNILYLLGGCSEDGASRAVFTAPLATLSITHQLKWNAQQDVPCSLSAPVSVRGIDLLLIGGDTNGECASNLYQLNKVNHSWKPIGSIPSGRHSSAAAAMADNRIIVIGGQNDEKRCTDTVWIG